MGFLGQEARAGGSPWWSDGESLPTFCRERPRVEVGSERSEEVRGL